VLVNCPINAENRKALPEYFNLHFAEEVPDRDTLLAKVGSDIRIIISDGPPHIGPALMDQMPSLKLVCLQSVGTDYMDMGQAKARGLYATNAAGTNLDETIFLRINSKILISKLKPSRDCRYPLLFLVEE
jgi:lactate dehydrogenase-like 2-hydroxyacid dehydrogenase